MKYLSNQYLKVGLDETSGYGIAEITSKTYPNINLINAYDKGRLVQNSIYSDADGSVWNNQPWMENWVQGGSWDGKRPNVTSTKLTQTTSETTTQGIHWATGKNGPVWFTQRITLDGPLLKVKHDTFYDGKTKGMPRHQEMPAVFVNPKYSRLMRLQNGLMVENIPGWPNEYFAIEKGFCAYVNGANWGIGMVSDCSHVTAYRFLPEGGQKSWCSYVAPIKTFSLYPGMRDSFSVTFTVGTMKQITTRLRV